MKNQFVLVLTITLLSLWSAAFGQNGEENGVIGIYFDPEGTIKSGGPISVYFELYVIISEPEFSHLYGWEAQIPEFSDGFVLYSSNFLGDVENQIAFPEFKVSYQEPMIVESGTILAELTIFILYQGSACLTLTGINSPAIPEELPLVWTGENNPVPISVAYLHSNGIAASINEGGGLTMPWECSTVVQVPRISFDAIKACYR